MLKSALNAFLIMAAVAAPALAQTAIQNGQTASGPKLPPGLSPATPALLPKQPVAMPPYKPAAPGISNGAVVAPTSTVGNTTSSVTGAGSTSSGYSASGSTVNTNLNNTNVGNRGPGQPIGGGSQTSSAFGHQTNGTNKH